MLEGDQRCFERDVRWEEMVHVDQGAAAGLFGALHRVQELSDAALERRRRSSTQAVGRCGCPTTAPEAPVWDTRATAKSAARDVEHAVTMGSEDPDLCTDGR